jgi:hypothetical protein
MDLNKAEIETALTLDKQIEVAEKNLQRTLEWISRFDGRAPLVLGLDTGMVAVLSGLAPPLQKWTNTIIATLSITLILLSAGLLAIYFAGYPRTKGSDQSLIYFGSIAFLSLTEYQQKSASLTQKVYLDDLLQQCHRNSEIVEKKFSLLKWAYRFLFAALPAWAITIYLFKSLA